MTGESSRASRKALCILIPVSAGAHFVSLLFRSAAGFLHGILGVVAVAENAVGYSENQRAVAINKVTDFIFREKLRPAQYIGCVIAVVGLILLNNWDKVFA